MATLCAGDMRGVYVRCDGQRARRWGGVLFEILLGTSAAEEGVVRVRCRCDSRAYDDCTTRGGGRQSACRSIDAVEVCRDCSSQLLRHVSLSRLLDVLEGVVVAHTE